MRHTTKRPKCLQKSTLLAAAFWTILLHSRSKFLVRLDDRPLQIDEPIAAPADKLSAAGRQAAEIVRPSVNQPIPARRGSSLFLLFSRKGFFRQKRESRRHVSMQFRGKYE